LITIYVIQGVDKRVTDFKYVLQSIKGKEMYQSAYVQALMVAEMW